MLQNRYEPEWGAVGLGPGPTQGIGWGAQSNALLLDVSVLLTAWWSCFWFGRVSLPELERNKEEGDPVEADVGWEGVSDDDRQTRKLPVGRKQAGGTQVGLGGELRSRSPGAASRKTALQFSVKTGNSSRESQPQRTSSAKETLSLEGIFYFYLLSQHRL